MKPASFAYESMGTHWEVSIWDPLEKDHLQKLKQEIIAMSEVFDNTYSRFIPTSLVSQISSQTGTVEVPEDFIHMLKLYEQFFKVSQKKVNPLIGNTLSDMGYDQNYSLKKKKAIHHTPDLLETVTIIDGTHIKIKEPVLFDFGGLGKGYFVDKITQFLLKNNLRQILVNGSGDINYQGDTPITVGLEHPRDTTKVIGTLEFSRGAMCSSATNRRAWGEYHHIIDPITRSSPSEILAAWVTTDAAALADGLTTALFFVPPEQFLPHYNFEYLLLNKDLKVKRSSGFKAVLF